MDKCYIRKEPYGVTLIMSAWNYPIQLIFLPMIGAIAAGNTVKFLNFRTPENFAVINLKFKQRGQILGYFVKKTQME